MRGAAHLGLYAAYRLPGNHPARALVKRTVRSALALTVCCNVLDRLLTLAGFLVSLIVRDLVLVAVRPYRSWLHRELHLLVAVTVYRSGNVSPEPPSSTATVRDGQEEAVAGKRAG